MSVCVSSVCLCVGPVVVCLHGGGFSALSWALFSKHLVEAAQCQVLAFDLRGHGDTKTSNDSDLSIETLSLDVGAVIQGFYINTEPPPVVLLGHRWVTFATLRECYHTHVILM